MKCDKTLVTDKRMGDTRDDSDDKKNNFEIRRESNEEKYMFERRIFFILNVRVERLPIYIF